MASHIALATINFPIVHVIAVGNINLLKILGSLVSAVQGVP